MLATSIAETSLTLDGVRIVVDSGLARRPRYDRAAGLTRLVTERASQAAVAQRAGRAGRQGPGRVYRLWEEAATQALPRFDPPEILEADLSALLLDCALWGVADPRSLRWLDPPPAAAIDEARKRLTSLGALDAQGRPTAHGRAIADLPLPPRLAHMLIEAEARGWGALAAEVAVLLSERGLGGQDADLELRLRRWRGEKGKRAEAARGLATRWRSLLVLRRRPERWPRTATLRPSRRQCGGPHRAGLSGQMANAATRRARTGSASAGAASAWTRRPARPRGLAGRRRGRRRGGGRAHPRRRADRPGDGREPVRRPDRRRHANHLRSRDRRRARLAWSPARRDPPLGRAGQPRRPAAVEAVLLEGVRTHGLEFLPWSEGARAFRTRAAFARGFDPAIADLSDEALLANLDHWLPVLLAGRRRLGEIDPGALAGTLDGLLGWDGRKAVDRLAPSHFETPAESRQPIDYQAEAGPTVETRVQTLFGLAAHPTVAAGKVPLVLTLTSPAGRPIQTTRDLPGFWKGSWADVAKEMRGRYPKHPWPENPAAAPPTTRAKPRAR